MGRTSLDQTMNYLVHRFNWIVQRIAFLLLWAGALTVALLASMWGIEAGQL